MIILSWYEANTCRVHGEGAYASHVHRAAYTRLLNSASRAPTQCFSDCTAVPKILKYCVSLYNIHSYIWLQQNSKYFELLTLAVAVSRNVETVLRMNSKRSLHAPLKHWKSDDNVLDQHKRIMVGLPGILLLKNFFLVSHFIVQVARARMFRNTA